jgi:hypothetical protein
MRGHDSAAVRSGAVGEAARLGGASQAQTGGATRYGGRVTAGPRCNWCGASFEPDDGYRAAEIAGERRAAFCRLEHIVPWAMHGAHWDAGPPYEPTPLGLERCSECDVAVDDTRIVLVRHRGEHRVADAFCGAEHLMVWARAGGRYR